MKTVKLNCASCGAPISIPDGVDTVVCTSCNSTLTVDRGDGFITLKVLEKLTDSIQEMGQMTSSAIKENSFVTQIELKRMQLQHLVSLEEMKVSSLQAEIRAAKRRTPPNVGITSELVDLVLQDNDARMHIRSIKQDIAHLDPGWEESLNVIREDRKLLDQAIACLTPYEPAAQVANQLQALRQERQHVDTAFNQLEFMLLKREHSSLNHPPFEKLTLEEMEALMEQIPGTLAQLNAGEQTPIRKKFIEDLTTVQKKIKAVYPRMKLEDQAGPLPSLDYQLPYPESPQELQPMIEQVRDDIARVEAAETSQEKSIILKALNPKLDELTNRLNLNIPAVKARKRKTRLIVGLSAAGLAVVACIIVAVISGGALIASNPSDSNVDGLVNQVQELVRNDENEPPSAEEIVSAGQFAPYNAGFFEVTANRTYLRDEPSTDATGTYEVNKGDILVYVEEGGLPPSWFKVTTLDGSASGYLAIDWVLPITVEAVPGDILQAEPKDALYQLDFSSETDAWTADEFDDEYARGWTEYQNGSYVIDITANDKYIYHYSNQTVDDLPENYIYSLTFSEIKLSGSAYYGLQTNVADDMNFDAVLIAPDGNLKLVVLREGQFTILYDTADSVNSMVALVPGTNMLSMRRQVDNVQNVEIYEYALNGQIFAKATMGKVGALKSDMGFIIYLDASGDHAAIGVDNFTITQ